GRVLVLEAGGRDNWIWFPIPVGYLYAIGNPRADWCFRTEPEPGLNGRSLAYPRGKVIGGSSAINAMIYMRGQAADYDHWRQLGLPGWGWDDVLPFFKRHQDHFLGAGPSHAARGGRRVAHRGAAHTLGPHRRGAGRRRASGDSAGRGFQLRRQRRLRLFPRQSETGQALVVGARLPQTGAQTPEPAAPDRLFGRTR